LKYKANLDRRYYHLTRAGDCFLGRIILFILGVLIGIFILQLPAIPADPDRQLTKMFTETIFCVSPRLT
jgi:hypothetical protein